MKEKICIGEVCIVKDAEMTLLDANMAWALGDLLAIEKHLVELESEDIMHSWCIKKHFTHLLHHALSEAIEHAEVVNKEKAKKLKEFKKEIEKIAEMPTLEKVREARNKLRIIMEDPTYESKCPICSLDK